jgi:hypothetical protein
MYYGHITPPKSESAIRSKLLKPLDSVFSSLLAHGVGGKRY